METQVCLAAILEFVEARLTVQQVYTTAPQNAAPIRLQCAALLYQQWHAFQLLRSRLADIAKAI